MRFFLIYFLLNLVIEVVLTIPSVRWVESEEGRQLITMILAAIIYFDWRLDRLSEAITPKKEGGGWKWKRG